MAQKTFATVGYEIPGYSGKELDFLSKSSLLDYDIVIINPKISSLLGYQSEHYQGKLCLNDTASFKLKEQIEHWRREIAESLKAGKNIFLMLNELEQVYAATGEKQYSGTGRNRQTTRIVGLLTNYDIVPKSIKITASTGTSMSIAKNANDLASYWSAMKEYSEYRVLIEKENAEPLIQTVKGQKTAGARCRFNNVDGILYLLPYIDFGKEVLVYEKNEEYFWTKEAEALGKKFIKEIYSIDKISKESNELTASPHWLVNEKYILPKEHTIQAELISTESQLESLQKHKELLEQQMLNESLLKRLLYETGKPLEKAIIIALEILGFTAKHYEDATSEFDVIFESKEGRLIGEAEGKDTKPINIDKLRQLAMNIHEDLSKPNVNKPAKGVLIGNAYRLQPPEERGEFFTSKCITAALSSNTALIKSTDLFYIVKYLSEKNDKKFARECRKAIISSVGVVNFPTIPQRENISTKILEQE